MIYPLDSAFQRLRNRRPYFIFIYCVQTLTTSHRLSVRLLQAAIAVIFSHVNENFIGRARRAQIKSVILLLLPVYSETNISNTHFQLDLNGSPVQMFPSPVNPALHAHA